MLNIYIIIIERIITREEVNNKPKGNTGLKVIIVLLLIAVLGLCGYIFVNRDVLITENKDTETNNTNTINNDSQQTEETDVEEQKGNTDSLVVFDPTLAIKSDGSFYDMWYALKDTGNY